MIFLKPEEKKIENIEALNKTMQTKVLVSKYIHMGKKKLDAKWLWFWMEMQKIGL